MSLRLTPQIRTALQFLFACAVLALLIWAVGFEIRQPYEGLQWNPLTGQILSIDPKGPADDLLELEDVILTINGTPAALAPRIISQVQVGDSLELEVDRGGAGKPVTIVLVAPPAREVVAREMPLLVALSFWLTGTGVLAFGRPGASARLFFWFCLVASGALTTGSLSATGPAWASTLFNILVWVAGPLSVHLHLFFPENRPLGKRGILIGSLYAIAAIGSAPFVLLGSDGVRASPANQLLFASGRLYLALNFLGVILLLLSAYRTASQVQARQRIRLLALGGGVGLLLAIALMILPGALLLQPLIPYQFGILFLMAVPLSYAHAIARHHLIRWESFLSRGAAYALVFAFMAGVYWILTSLIRWLTPSDWLQLPFANMLIVLMLSGTAVLLYRRIQAVVDWAFYGGWYDYRSAVERITAGLEGAHDLEVFAERITERLKSILRLESACAFLLGRDGVLHRMPAQACPIPGTQSDPRGTEPLDLPIDGPVAAQLQQVREAILAGKLAEQLRPVPLSKAEADMLDAYADLLLVPMLGSHELLGLLAMGKHQGSEAFSTEDIGIMNLVARHAGAALENIHLLYEIKSRVAEVERLHQRILGAREDERKLLARELHDEAIQSLVALKYKLAHTDNGQVAELQDDVRGVIDELREMIRDLRPPALDNFGLITALRSYVRELGAKHEGALRIDFVVVGDEQRQLPEAVGLCLYRVAQEALANVERHSHAARAELLLELSPEQAALSVQDDGRGFTVPKQLGQLLEQNHFGLVGLRERVELARGNLEIYSAPGHGTTLKARIPLQ